MNKTFEIHAWLVAVLLISVLCMFVLLLVMMHVHAGDVAYIAHTHRPVFIVPAPGPSPVVSA